jgi:hypothetical protein
VESPAGLACQPRWVQDAAVPSPAAGAGVVPRVAPGGGGVVPGVVVRGKKLMRSSLSSRPRTCSVELPHCSRMRTEVCVGGGGDGVSSQGEGSGWGEMG